MIIYMAMTLGLEIMVQVAGTWAGPVMVFIITLAG